MFLELFLGHIFFCLLSPISFYLILLYLFCSLYFNERERKGVDLGRRERRKDLGGVTGVKP